MCHSGPTTQFHGLDLSGACSFDLGLEFGNVRALGGRWRPVADAIADEPARR